MTAESMTGMIDWIIKGSRHETQSLPDNLIYSTSKSGSPDWVGLEKEKQEECGSHNARAKFRTQKGLPAHTKQQGMLCGINQVLREAPPEGRLYRHRTTREELWKVSTVVKWRDRSYGYGS